MINLLFIRHHMNISGERRWNLGRKTKNRMTTFCHHTFHKPIFMLSLWAFIIINLTRYSQLSSMINNNSTDVGTMKIYFNNSSQYGLGGIHDNAKDFLESTLASQITYAFSDPDLAYLYQNKSILYDKSTHQGKAFDWLLNFDKYKHNSQKNDPSDENPTIVQRYILAVLYFATGGEFNYNIGKKFSPDDNKVGFWTKYGTLRFLSPNLHECSWYDRNFHGLLKGVISCDYNTKEITELILPELGIIGQLPEEIGYLTKLETLDLQNNYLNGSIPKSIGRLTSLRTLALGHNNFEGILPSSMGSMVSLETLYINYNSFEGDNSIPLSLCHLHSTGRLFNIWADCNRQVNPVHCECCTICCDPLSKNCSPIFSSQNYEYDNIMDDGEFLSL